MKALWARLSARFAALARREKIIVAAALVVGTIALGDKFWMAPGFSEHARTTKQLSAKRDEVAQLSRQIVELTSKLQNAETGNRLAIDAAKKDLVGVAAQLASFERALVPPQRMAAFLQDLLPAAGGLEVVSLKTLAPEPLVQPKPPEAGATPKAAAAPAAPSAAPAPADAPPPSSAAGPATLYKHGVELRLAGSYQGLHDYLTQLENAPQKVLWGRLELKVVQYPRSELVITLYTLSLDPSWLIV